MSTKRHNSPWAADDSTVKCTRCGSSKIFRILNRWAFSKGVQMFECTSCGKKFYDKGYDDYSPTFNV
ncbi:MAG: hypothetical protein E3J82_01605 [Candidatus Thorarchaeota archaeon]|nr:MAG: hypothetical protein E3J82_01605 [Candidatus Thorarchaeota archaeon]